MGTAEIKSNNITPPRAGQVTVIAVTTSAGSQDLRLCGVQVANMASANGGTGLQARFVTFYADGADVGLVFGPTAASVTTTNAPALATTGVNAAGACYRIANGGEKSWLLAAGTDVFVGFVGSAAGNLRIVASSP